jgi:hypothetical protein
MTIQDYRVVNSNFGDGILRTVLILSSYQAAASLRRDVSPDKSDSTGHLEEIQDAGF